MDAPDRGVLFHAHLQAAVASYPLGQKEEETMKEFQGKVAVITGAASGIGRALAAHSAQEGMKVVLADIEQPALRQAEAELKATGADVLAVHTDVSKAGDVDALAQAALDTYGAVHLLCNNAGVGTGSSAWESTHNDWEWVMGVNLWGVIHGVRAFVPAMLAQGTEAHIVNTASLAGLISYHGSAAYHTTKHAIVALSEKMYYDLAMRGSKIKVSVLCPGWVRTRVMDSERNRPPELMIDPASVVISPEMEAVVAEYRQACEAGMAPEVVADCVFDAIRDERLYILTHPDMMPFVAARVGALMEGKNPMPMG
jgi:NAD(P)-dependent dehydrogenase (short-subunit alcohol dehydrogenase family)